MPRSLRLWPVEPRKSRWAGNALTMGKFVPKQETVLAHFVAPKHAPDAPFLEFDEADSALNWSTFDDRVRRMAQGMRNLGIVPGDRVAALLDNGPTIVVAWFATMAIGAIWVPLNIALRGTMLREILEDAAPHLLFIEPDILEGQSAQLLDLPWKPMVVVDAQDTPAQWADQLLSVNVVQAEPLIDLVDAKPDTVACLIYTSGTTGPSKGCMIPHAFLMSLSRQGAYDRQADEPAYTALPLFHFNAMTTVILTMVLGSRTRIGRRFSVSGFWTAIEQSGARFVNLLGPMATMLASAPDDPAMLRCRGQLRRALSAPFPESARTVFRERFGVQEVQSGGMYGMTEAALLTNNPDWEDQPAGCSGKRWGLFDVEVVDDDGVILGPEQVGEIVCRPRYPNIMFAGYWNKPEATLTAFRNLWFHTGDVGRFDAEGHLFFVDRKKDYLRRRGENISCFEVEQVFLKHPAVAEVAIYGVPSDVGEDDVQASIVLASDAQIDEAGLCQWSVDNLPYFAVPRYMELRSDLPKSATGRVRKVELRDRPPGYPRWDREAHAIDLKRRH